jgi:predicted N-acetyltransferase YhbS
MNDGNIKYKILEKPNYEAIADCIGNNPKRTRWKNHPDWGIELFKFHAPDPNLYIGAYDGDILVGCMISHQRKLKIQKKIYNCVVIAMTEVLMNYRNQGIASTMLDTLIDQLKKLGYDAVFAFHIANWGGKKLLKEKGFEKLLKYGHATKVLDTKKMEKLIDLNPVLKKIAMKLVDPSIGEIKPKRGEIREVKKDELDQVVNLLNTHSEVLDIGSLWTREFLQKMIDWRYKIYVWVDNDNEEVLGAVITYEEVADLGKEDFICGFLKEMVF